MNNSFTKIDPQKIEMKKIVILLYETVFWIILLLPSHKYPKAVDNFILIIIDEMRIPDRKLKLPQNLLNAKH